MSEDANETREIAGLIAPPPLIYGGALGAGLLAKALFPIIFLPPAVARALGLLLTGSGFCYSSPASAPCAAAWDH